MTNDEWERIREDIRLGKLLIGVHTAKAVEFFDKTKEEMTEAIGESATLFRSIVLYPMYIASLLFFFSIYCAIRAFGWWSLLAVLASLVLFAFKYAYAQLGKQRIIPTIVISIVICIGVFNAQVSFWIKVWVTSLILYVLLMKFRFYVAPNFIRIIVVRNYKAFNLLIEDVIFI